MIVQNVITKKTIILLFQVMELKELREFFASKASRSCFGKRTSPSGAERRELRDDTFVVVFSANNKVSSG